MLNVALAKSHINIVVIGHVNACESSASHYNNTIKRSSKYAWVLNKLISERNHGMTMDIALWKIETPKYNITIIDAAEHSDFIKLMIAGTRVDYTVFLASPTLTCRAKVNEHILLAYVLDMTQVIITYKKSTTSIQPTIENMYRSLLRGDKPAAYDCDNKCQVASNDLSGGTLDASVHTPPIFCIRIAECAKRLLSSSAQSCFEIYSLHKDTGKVKFGGPSLEFPHKMPYITKTHRASFNTRELNKSRSIAEAVANGEVFKDGHCNVIRTSCGEDSGFTRTQAFPKCDNMFSNTTCAVGLSSATHEQHVIVGEKAANISNTFDKINRERTQVFIAVKGKNIALEVAAEDSISSIKEMIFKKAGIPPTQQRLIFAGKQLADHQTIAESQLYAASTLSLEGRVMGGMKKISQYLLGTKAENIEVNNFSPYPEVTNKEGMEEEVETKVVGESVDAIDKKWAKSEKEVLFSNLLATRGSFPKLSEAIGTKTATEVEQFLNHMLQTDRSDLLYLFARDLVALCDSIPKLLDMIDHYCDAEEDTKRQNKLLDESLQLQNALLDKAVTEKSALLDKAVNEKRENIKVMTAEKMALTTANSARKRVQESPFFRTSTNNNNNSTPVATSYGDTARQLQFDTPKTPPYKLFSPPRPLSEADHMQLLAYKEGCEYVTKHKKEIERLKEADVKKKYTACNVEYTQHKNLRVAANYLHREAKNQLQRYEIKYPEIFVKAEPTDE